MRTPVSPVCPKSVLLLSVFISITSHGQEIRTSIVGGDTSDGSAQAKPKESLPESAMRPSFLRQLDGRANRESIPMVDAMWGVFVQINALEGHSPGMGHRLLTESVGLEEEEAWRLVAYVEDALELTRQRSSDLRDGFCSRRQQIATRSDLATAVVVLHEQEKQNLSTAVYDLATAVSGESEATLHHWIDENIRPHMTGVEIDHAARLNSTHIVKDDVLNRMCGE